MPNALRPLFLKSLCLYSLFLVPTGLLLAYAGSSDASLSTQMGGTWQATVWHFPGLNELASRVLLDALEALAITALGWLFYQGFQVFQNPEKNGLADTTTQAQWVLLWTALTGGMLIFATPFHSSDIFGYLNRGFQQSIFHTNPYLTTISQIPGWSSSHLLHAHWIDNPCPYGFFFARLTNWLTQWADLSFTLAYLLFKALNGLCLLACTWMIAQIGHLLGHKRPWLSAYLLGANPLVLLHTMGNGHNDIIMVFLLLLAIRCLLSPLLRSLTLPLLTVSILTKYASLLAAPFLLIALLRKKSYSALWLGGLLSLLVALWLGSAYIDLSQPWPWKALLDNAGKPQHSLISLLEGLIYYPLKWTHFPAKTIQAGFLQIIKPLFWAGFSGFYGWRLWKVRKSNPLKDSTVVYEIALVSVVMIAFTSAKFHPWYPVMFLPLCLLLPEQAHLRQFTLIFCLFQLAGFTILQNLPVFSEILLTLVPVWMTLQGSALFKAPEPVNTMDSKT